MIREAALVLADGTTFEGEAIGADKPVSSGEVVFNTALTGYQEILTDPSYAQQLVTLTYPHIGNTGVNEQDVEAGKVHAAGLIIRDLALLHSNFRTTRSLTQYLRDEGTVAIADVDTRRLTRLLREKGAQNGCILALPRGTAPTAEHVAEALKRAQAAPSMAGLDLAKVVSVDTPYPWQETEWRLTGGADGLP